MMRNTRYLAFSALIATILISNTICTSASVTSFTNPILDKVGADPWVTRHGGYYYMTYTTNDNITLLRSSVLTNWDGAPVKLILEPPANTSFTYDLWAPELHQFGDKWYIIFTADIDTDSPKPEQDMLCDYSCPALNHRMFVLESSGADPWTSQYSMKNELDTYDQFAIDGTYLQVGGGLYHVYSCWYDAHTSWPAMLCISKMSNPWTVSSSLSERTIISKPTNPWEKTPYGRSVNDRLSSNEGPQQLTNPYTNQTFIIYSAARSDNRNYCLGLLELKSPASDPMKVDSWNKNNAGCVFEQNAAEQAYGVGHASFTISPDGTENWIVYHGMKDPSNGWKARTIRTQQFTWDARTGQPVFPKPGYGPYGIPSGQV